MADATIQVKRVYTAAADDDGMRVLVDRIWPRGVSKDKAALHEWLKSVAPSTELRQWFDHDPDKWAEFCQRYRAELQEPERAEGVARLRELYTAGPLTLVFAAKDEAHNNAVVLKNLLEHG